MHIDKKTIPRGGGGGESGVGCDKKGGYDIVTRY
jgi:hypothetical protein